MKRRVLMWCAATAAVIGLAQTASASSITLYPASGNAAGNATTSAPGFPSESWQGNGTSKAEVYIPASLLFSGPVLFSDINSISYWTNKPGVAPQDWSLYIYTKPADAATDPTNTAVGPGDSATWYRSRLTAEPYFTNTAVPANTWHEWSTSDPNNPLIFYDGPRAGNNGTYNDPTLATLQSNAFTWPSSNVQHDYRNEEILFFSLQTGSGWANGFTGLVDGLTITATTAAGGREIGTVNLEAAAAPVPEPASLVLLGTGLIGAGARRWRKRNA